MAITLNGTTGITTPVITTPVINAGNIVGEVAFFALNTPPTGWIKSNGAAISRTAYASLFAAIGTTYGVGNGSSTFNLPDMRGEFPRGWDDGRAVDSGRAFGGAQAQDWKGFFMTNTGQNTYAYSHGFVDMGKSTGSFVGNLFGGYWAAPGGAIGTRWNAADEVRPRNIALLACIKF